MGRNITFYGERVLEEQISGLERAVVVTDEIPWQLHRSRFEVLEAYPVMPGTLERSTLDELATELPRDAQIIGLGGGSVIDAAKYFADLRGQVPTLVPSITSSNAQFSDFISVRSNGRPVGMKGQERQRRIIVDFQLIGQADKRLNRAGYGDLLSLQTTLLDWRQAAAAGKGVPVDESVASRISELMGRARSAATEIGSVSARGIELIMRLFEDSTNEMMEHSDKPVSAGGEHLFAWNLESVTGMHFLHGEIVALGSVITEYLHEPGASDLRSALEDAKVCFRLSELELEWSEVEETLLTLKKYNDEVRGFNTVFDHVDWTPGLLEEIHVLVR